VQKARQKESTKHARHPPTQHKLDNFFEKIEPTKRKKQLVKKTNIHEKKLTLYETKGVALTEKLSAGTLESINSPKSPKSGCCLALA
jgi:hypothetical protein